MRVVGLKLFANLRLKTFHPSRSGLLAVQSSKIAAALKETGYFLAKGVPEQELTSFAEILGNICVDSRSSEPVREIRPQPKAEAKSNTLSSRHGMGRFPFHTDVAHWRKPAHFVLLYCKKPGSGSRVTYIQDSHAWQLTSELRAMITREVWKTGHFRPHLCTIGARSGNRILLRFDEGCMTPLTKSAMNLRDKLVDIIEASSSVEIHWAPGTMVILDNRRILHARGAAYKWDEDRIIKRILFRGQT